MREKLVEIFTTFLHPGNVHITMIVILEARLEFELNWHHLPHRLVFTLFSEVIFLFCYFLFMSLYLAPIGKKIYDISLLDMA